MKKTAITIALLTITCNSLKAGDWPIIRPLVPGVHTFLAERNKVQNLNNYDCLDAATGMMRSLHSEPRQMEAEIWIVQIMLVRSTEKTLHAVVKYGDFIFDPAFDKIYRTLPAYYKFIRKEDA